MDRRQFIKNTSLTGVGLGVTSQIKAFAPVHKSTVNLGMIAVGFRGQAHLEEFFQRDDVNVVAIADPSERMINDTLTLFRKFNKKEPAIYKNGNYDYQQLLKRDDIDAVMISSPWEWHITQGVDAMKVGKIVGMEA